VLRNLKQLVWLANILLVILTIASYFAPQFQPSTSGFFALLGLGFPALLFCNVLSIIFWIFLKPKRALLSLIVIVVGYQSCNRLVTFSKADSPDKSKTQLLVGAYNINFSKPIAFTPKAERKKLETEFESYLNSKDNIDILAVQEHGWRSKRYLKSFMDFPYLHEVDNMTVAIYSKYPFAQVGKVDFGSNVANTCIWADILVSESDTVRIYSAHLESNRHNGKVPEVIDQEAEENMSNSALFGIVKHYQNFSQARADQAKLIKQHKRTAPHPSIICGDLNDTPLSHVYKIMSENMQDSFYEEGLGLGTTFGEKIPALRIDYIFVDNGFEVLEHTISRSEFSDHYLQTAQLEL